VIVAPLRKLLDPRRPLTYGIVQAGPNFEGGTPYIRPTDMTESSGVVDESQLLRTSPDIAAAYERASLRAGDIVLSIGPSYGKVMVVPPSLDGANLTQGTARLAPGVGVFGRWLYWVLQARTSTAFWGAVAAGGTFRALNLGPLGETPIPVTPSPEQRRIADFLDDRVARIDQIITARLQQVVAARDMEQSLLTQALLASDDTFAPLRHLGVTVTTGPFGTVFAATDYVEGGVPMINPTHIKDGVVTPDVNHSVSRATASRLARHRLRAGDLVVSRKGDLGRTAMIQTEQDGWICGSDSIALHARSDAVDPKMLDLLFKLVSSRDQLLSQSIGATMPNLNEGNLLSLRVPILDEDERLKRVAAGEEVRCWARSTSSDLEQSVALLQEYKQSLITAAVTGKLDVTAAGSGIPG